MPTATAISTSVRRINRAYMVRRVITTAMLTILARVWLASPAPTANAICETVDTTSCPVSTTERVSITSTYSATSASVSVVESVRVVSQCLHVSTISNRVTTAASVTPTSRPAAASVRLDSLDASVSWTWMTARHSRASTVAVSTNATASGASARSAIPEVGATWTSTTVGRCAVRVSTADCASTASTSSRAAVRAATPVLCASSAPPRPTRVRTAGEPTASTTGPRRRPCRTAGRRRV